MTTMVLPTNGVLLPVYVLPLVLSIIDFSNIILCHQGEVKLKLGHDQITEKCIVFYQKNNTSLKPLSDVSHWSGISTLFFPPPISCREDCSDLLTKVGGGNSPITYVSRKRLTRSVCEFRICVCWALVPELRQGILCLPVWFNNPWVWMVCKL